LTVRPDVSLASYLKVSAMFQFLGAD